MVQPIMKDPMFLAQKSVPAGEEGGFRDYFHRRDPVAEVGALDFGTQGAEAIGGGVHVPAGLRAADVRGSVCQGRADEIPVGLGFGGDDLDGSTEFFGVDGDVHIKDLPE